MMIHRYVFCAVFWLTTVFASSASRNVSAQAQDLLPQPTAEDRAWLESSKKISEHITAIEWLGPLAPIALSPFFGLACLSGIATYGPEWLQQRSGLFGASSPLNNPALFWSMVVLTVVTSLPRLSKVSKPLALAAEKLEAYSVVIIVVAMRVFGSSENEAASTVVASIPFYQSAGLASIPLDVALAIASAINILVINGVKLFCELVIWLTPIPFIDAVVEATNKALCVALMSLYCWSPWMASIVNLALLAICASVYLWTQRRIVYYLDLIAGPMLVGWMPGRFAENGDGETVFLAESWNGLPKLTPLRLKGSPSEGWRLTRRGWWSRNQYSLQPARHGIESGLIAEIIRIPDGDSLVVVLHQRRMVKGRDAFPVAPGGSPVA